MNEQIVKQYFELFFSENVKYDKIRTLLADDFHFTGPLLRANSADEYINILKNVGAGNLSANINSILSNENEVAVFYNMITPFGEVKTVEWFLFENNKIKSIELLNDPRKFLEAFSK